MYQRFVFGHYSYCMSLEAGIGTFYLYLEDVQVALAAYPFHFRAVSIFNLFALV